MTNTVELIETAFEIVNPDGLKIRGVEFVRKDRSGFLPAVIISHGFTGNMNENRSSAAHYAEAGFRVFIFDFCGGGFATISEGSFEDYMTPMTEKGDLHAVFSYVKGRADVDSSSIILEGHSQGGFVSALVAAELKEEVKALILMYPAFCIPDDARKGAMQTIRFDPENIPDQIGTPPMRISGEYAKSVIRMDVYKEITGYHGRVLILHGTRDSIVPYTYVERALEAYEQNGNQVALFPIKGSDHGFQGPFFDEAESHVEAFLRDVIS